MQRKPGFTLVELIAVVGLVAVLVVLALVSMTGRPTNCSSTLKEASQIRGIVQAIKNWSEANAGKPPLPSSIDTADATVSERGRAKDTTVNLYSMLIYEQSITPEIVVAPLECNSNIRVCQGYEYSRPRAAVSPDHALWDPAFSADFTSATPGNVSFAHLQPAGARSKMWSRDALQDAKLGDTSLVSSRGPEVIGCQADNRGVITASYTDPNSITLCDSASFCARWAGNVGFTDGRVDWLTNDFGPLEYQSASGRPIADALFFDEPDDPAAANTFLGIFIRAGATPADYKAIWD